MTEKEFINKPTFEETAILCAIASNYTYQLVDDDNPIKISFMGIEKVIEKWEEIKKSRNGR